MPGDAVTPRELYRQAAQALSSPFEADQLLFAVTGLHRYDLPLRGDQPCDAGEAARLSELCRRRLEGEPLQYLLGEWEFFALRFLVGPGVLIPRPDTEILVETALKLLDKTSAPEVADLFSGSGCVAVALQKHLPGARLAAVELSDEAFAYLQKNVALHQSPVACVQGDALDYHPPCPLDLITLNPPYLTPEDLAGLSPEVRREPQMALLGGRDGLYFYREIAARYFDRLKAGGWLCAEVGLGQNRAVARILESAGYGPAREALDIAGIERVVYAQKPLE